MADPTSEGQAAATPDVPQAVFVPADAGRVLNFLAVTHRLTSEQSGGSIYIFESAFEPGTGNRLHVHSREDEIAYVLEGALEVRLPDRTAILEAGGVGRLPKGLPHAIRKSARDTIAVPVPGRPGRARPVVRCRSEGER